MIERILVTLISFILFIYVFLFKMMKKNDTTYLVIIIGQAIGIFINFILITSGFLSEAFFRIIVYLLGIIIPAIVLIMELKGINFAEIANVFISKVYIYLNNRKKAKMILVEFVSKYKESYLGHKMLAEIYEQEGGMRKAIDEYVKVLDIKSSDYNSYYKIAYLLNELTQKEESINMLKKLVKKKPDMYEAVDLLANLLIEKKEYKEVIKTYNNNLKYNEDKYETYYNLAISYSMINDFSLAKDCYKKAIELNNNLYNAYYNLGQISLLYRDLEVAEDYFSKSINEQMEAKAYYELSKIYIIKNQKEKAIMFLNKAIEQDSNIYERAKSEPVLFALKNNIIKPQKETIREDNRLEKEKIVEEYLNDTYNLTKVLDEKNNNKINKFKWQQS